MFELRQCGARLVGLVRRGADAGYAKPVGGRWGSKILNSCCAKSGTDMEIRSGFTNSVVPHEHIAEQRTHDSLVASPFLGGGITSRGRPSRK